MNINITKVLSPLGFFLVFGSALFSNELKDVSAGTPTGTHKLVLYDAASGVVPSAPLMSFIDFPTGAALPTYSDGGTIMDTTISGGDTYAGWISNGASIVGFPILDRTMGFQVSFTIQVEDELHKNKNRAGFSVIVLDKDRRGVELAFWEDEVWAQGDEITGGLFKHGEGINFATTAAFTDYQIAIIDDTYTLTADTKPILTGPVRDYSGFKGFPDPYETPNFMFIGDDTTSAQARVRLRYVSIAGKEPVVSTSSSSPLPINSPTALSSSPPIPSSSPTTPIPSPAPSPKLFDFCPSSLSVLVLIGMLKFINREPGLWSKIKK